LSSITLPAYAEVTSLTTDNTFYNGGSVITFSGTTLSTDTPNVTLLIFDSNNKFVYLATGITNSNHEFKIIVDTGAQNNPQKFSLKGIYNATAFTANKNSGKTVSFGFSPNGSPPSSSQIPNNEGNTISVFTDSPSYQQGQIMKISGAVSQYEADTPLSMKVFNPSHQLVTSSLQMVRSDGSFIRYFLTDGSMWKDAGSYSITTIYGKYTQTTTFDFSGGTGQIISEKNNPLTPVTAPMPFGNGTILHMFLIYNASPAVEDMQLANYNWAVNTQKAESIILSSGNSTETMQNIIHELEKQEGILQAEEPTINESYPNGTLTQEYSHWWMENYVTQELVNSFHSVNSNFVGNVLMQEELNHIDVSSQLIIDRFDMNGGEPHPAYSPPVTQPPVIHLAPLTPVTAPMPFGNGTILHMFLIYNTSPVEDDNLIYYNTAVNLREVRSLIVDSYDPTGTMQNILYELENQMLTLAKEQQNIKRYNPDGSLTPQFTKWGMEAGVTYELIDSIQSLHEYEKRGMLQFALSVIDVDTQKTLDSYDVNGGSQQPPPNQPQSTSPTAFTPTPQDIQNINQAENNQTIAVEVNVGDNQSAIIPIDSNVTVQTTINNPDSLDAKVSAPDQTGPKVIMFNLPATTINVANLKDLGVMYDGKPILPAPNMYAILHAKSTDNPSFAIVVTQSGVQILVLVPHFSTHTITITNMSKIIPVVPEFPFSILALIIATFSIVLVPKIRYR